MILKLLQFRKSIIHEQNAKYFQIIKMNYTVNLAGFQKHEHSKDGFTTCLRVLELLFVDFLVSQIQT